MLPVFCQHTVAETTSSLLQNCTPLEHVD